MKRNTDQNKAAVLCNGTPPSAQLLLRELGEECAVYCADGAAKWALSMGARIDVLVGDMDSLDEQTLRRVEQSGAQVIWLNREKDETDAQTALELAISRGARDIVLLGATGTRLDHTLGNLQLLVGCRRRGISARIVDDHNEVFVADSRVEFSGSAGKLLSIIPLGMGVRVTTHNLYYPLYEHVLDLGRPLGVSNVFLGDWAAVDVWDGMIAVILAAD